MRTIRRCTKTFEIRKNFSPLISARYKADYAIKAFEKNKEKEVLKVLLEFDK